MMNHPTTLAGIVLGVCLAGLSSNAQASPSGAAAQVCADIVAQYGIAPEGCDPEQDARTAAVETPQAGDVMPEQKAGSIPGVVLDSNIFFTNGGDKLDANAQERLSLLAKILSTELMADACLRLVGHSDTSGPSTLNHKLALRRAESVANYLRPAINHPDRIEEVASEGEDSPLAGIDGEDSRNRRVTIYARPCPQP